MSQQPIFTFAPFNGVINRFPAYAIGEGYVAAADRVSFRNGQAQRMEGYSTWQTMPAPNNRVLFLQWYDRSDDTKDLIAVEGGTIYRWDGTTWSNIMGIEPALNSWANNRQIHAVLFRNRMILTDGATAVRDINFPTNSTVVNLGGLSAIASSARCVATVAPQRVVVGWTVEGGQSRPNAVRASADGDPTTWTGAGTLNTELYDESDAILAMHRLYRDCIIYRTRSIWVMRYVGGSLLFEFRPMTRGIGLYRPLPNAYSPRSVAVIGRKHFFLGSDDFYVLMGADTEPQSIGEPIREQFFADVNVANAWKIFTVVDQDSKEVWWWYPSGASADPNKAIVFNYEVPAWTMYSADGTDVFYSGLVAERLSTNPINLTLGTSGGVIKSMSSFDIGGNVYTSSLTTRVSDFGVPLRKRVDAIRLKAQGSAKSLLVSIGTASDLYSTPTFGNEVVCPVSGEFGGWFKVNAVGRAFQVRVRDTAKGSSWTLSAIDLRWVPLSR